MNEDEVQTLRSGLNDWGAIVNKIRGMLIRDLLAETPSRRAGPGELLGCVDELQRKHRELNARLSEIEPGPRAAEREPAPWPPD
jgi:hypothetical protein